MAETLNVFIDLNDAGLDLDPEELETYSRRLAEELNDGLAEDASLARSPQAPDGSKAGEAGFDLGILKAEINLKNLKAVLDWLGQKVYGSTIKLEYGEVKLEYRTPQQLQEQLQALERISELKIRVVKSEAGKG
jgi:hypothetical protein